jgi:hypothetical protein
MVTSINKFAKMQTRPYAYVTLSINLSIRRELEDLRFQLKAIQCNSEAMSSQQQILKIANTTRR